MKHLMTVAGFTALCVSSANVLADTVLYGKAHVALVNETVEADGDDKGTGELILESRASRFGVKGKAELSEGLDAIYKWETEVKWNNATDGAGDTQLKARNTYVGLKGGFGKVIMGINDTPMKQSEGKVDVFSDREDMAKIQDAFVDTQERENNIVSYYSPKFNNMQFAVATMPGKSAEEIGYAWSTSLVYGDKKLKKTPFYAAIAYDDKVDGDTTDALRVVGSAKMGGFTVGALAEQVTKEDGDAATDDEQMRYLLSGKYKFDKKNTVLLQHVSAEEVNGQTSSSAFKGGNELNSTSIGLDHKLGKQTKLYGMYTVRKDETVNTEKTKVAIGLEHKF